jgi:hypothetical protein
LWKGKRSRQQNETINNEIKIKVEMKTKTNKTSQTFFTILALAGFTAIFLGGVHSGYADIFVTAKATASSGTNGTCPGGFIGYATYTKSPAEGWGWAPTNTVHTVTDTNRTDTKVQFKGMFGDNGCNQTTVTLPNPAVSPKYQFTVYFTNNVPTNSYTIELKGFSP